MNRSINFERDKNESINFSFFEFAKKEKKKIAMIILSSFLFAFASTSLLTKAATIPTGLSAVSLTSSFIFPVVKPYLNFIYLGLNIPLFLIFWKKVKKSYAYLTLLFLITNAIFGFLIGFDFGQFSGTSMSFDIWLTQNVIIFCPPSSEYERAFATEHNLNNLINVSINEYNEWLKSKGFLGEFNPTHLYSAKTIGVEKGWPIFVYMLCAVTLSATSAAIAWKCGASTGGTDIIAYYYSTKKKKSIGSLLMVIGMIIVSTSLFIVWSLASFGPNSIKSNINGFTSIIGLQTLSSAIYVVLYGKILNMIYPKYKKVLIRIDTVNKDKIKKFLDDSHFNHPFKIYSLISSKTGKEIYTFETIVLLLESEEFIRIIKEVDPTAWVSKFEVQNVYGRFDYSAVE